MGGLARAFNKFGVVVALALASTAALSANLTLFGKEETPDVVNGPAGKYKPSDVMKAYRDGFEAGLTNKSSEEFAMTMSLSSILGGKGSMSFPAGAVGALDNEPNDTGGQGGFLGRFDTTGDAAATWVEGNGGFKITLTNPVKAFGAYFTDAGDFSQDAQLIDLIIDGGAPIAVGPLVNGAPGSLGSANGLLLFFAFTSDTAFSTIEFRFRQQGCDPAAGDSCVFDYVGIDSIVIGDPGNGGGDTPEPTTLALLGLALAGAGVARRRRH